MGKMGEKKELSPLGKLIKICMILQGVSSQELAKKLGVTPGYISLLIHGKKSNPKKMQKIMEELGLYFLVSDLVNDFSKNENLSQDKK